MKRLWVLALLCGCAGAWYKPGSTLSEFEMDKGQCNAMAYSSSNTMYAGAIFVNCMKGKGWAYH